MQQSESPCVALVIFFHYVCNQAQYKLIFVKGTCHARMDTGLIIQCIVMWNTRHLCADVYRLVADSFAHLVVFQLF